MFVLVVGGAGFIGKEAAYLPAKHGNAEARVTPTIAERVMFPH